MSYWVHHSLSHRFTGNYKYLIVAHLNINRLAILAAPPVGEIGDCAIVSTIQLADETKPHLVDVDVKSGAIYIAEIGAQQVQRFVPLSWWFPTTAVAQAVWHVRPMITFPWIFCSLSFLRQAQNIVHRTLGRRVCSCCSSGKVLGRELLIVWVMQWWLFLFLETGR